MKFLLQHNMLSNEQLNIILEATKPFPCEWIGLIPFSHEIISDEPLSGVDYIPYGSTSLTEVCHELGHKGLFFNPETFLYRKGLLNRSDMLNSPIFIGRVEAGIKALDRMEVDHSIFIRPDADLKQFNGQVTTAGECVTWLKSALDCASSGNQQLLPDTQIVIAPVQDIQAEWRWFIVGGKIVSGSMYRHMGRMLRERVTDQSMIDEAQTMADGWLPAPCCVMDTALVDGELKVIEFNCINSSGTYDNDVPAIFAELYKYCENN